MACVLRRATPANEPHTNAVITTARPTSKYSSLSKPARSPASQPLPRPPAQVPPASLQASRATLEDDSMGTPGMPSERSGRAWEMLNNQPARSVGSRPELGKITSQTHREAHPVYLLDNSPMIFPIGGPMRSATLLGLLFIAITWRPVRGADLGRDQQDLFTSRVRPILARHCFKCHGPDDKARKAKLRLDLREQAVKPAAFGSRRDRPRQARRERAGRAASSPTIRPSVMPPAAAKLPLSEPTRRKFSSIGSPTGPSTRRTGRSSPPRNEPPPRFAALRPGRRTRSMRSSSPGSRPKGYTRPSRPIARP